MKQSKKLSWRIDSKKLIDWKTIYVKLPINYLYRAQSIREKNKLRRISDT